MAKIIPSSHPDDDTHFKEFHLSREKIAQWEDGLRTGNKPGTYEWWYFDTHLQDGTIIVVVFYTKSAVNPKGPAAPYATFEITSPEGKTQMETVRVPVEQSHFETACCDIKIGNCSFKGNLTDYKIHFENEKVTADIELNGTVPTWRPKCGSILFGKNEEYQFAWIPSVPEGNVRADVTMNGKKKHYEGYGYHDHNWGNISMLKLMNHWYWGRAKIGPYTVITSWITSEKQYGYKDFDVFMIAKDGKILTEGKNGNIQFHPAKVQIEEHTGKPVHDQLLYTYSDNSGLEYRVSYEKEKFISKERFIDGLPPVQKFLAKLVKMNGAYMRFSGKASIECLQNGKPVEAYSDPAVWELMYFGKNHL